MIYITLIWHLHLYIYVRYMWSSLSLCEAEQNLLGHIYI